MKCIICGGSNWGHQGNRQNVRCMDCNSLERTRIIKLHLDRLEIPRPGYRVLHIAPEKGLSEWLIERAGSGYEAVDLDPDMFSFCKARKLDLCRDAEKLAANSYDIILHSHVMEHLPCNLTAVLFFLHRALTPRGHHIFSAPILGGRYDEYLGPLSESDSIARFGQRDHVRRIARADLDVTLGMIFKGDLERHCLDACFDDVTLDGANVPHSARSGLNSSTVFVFGKDDLRLVA